MSDRLQKLEQLVTLLRGPAGCPWDRDQTLSDLRAYLLEEAHEAAAAIDSDNPDELSEELGDLLFQIVFVARICEESGYFDLSSVIERIHAKMVERHPHVFGDEQLPDSAAVRSAWEKRKLRDRQRSILADVPASLPALVAAYRVTQKVSAVGFDWPDVDSVLEKVDEELRELRGEIHSPNAGEGRESLREELGDLLFTIANLSRKLEIDPEAALAAANAKFRRRFQQVEVLVQERGKSLENATLGDLDKIWNEVKAGE